MAAQTSPWALWGLWEQNAVRVRQGGVIFSPALSPSLSLGLGSWGAWGGVLGEGRRAYLPQNSSQPTWGTWAQECSFPKPGPSSRGPCPSGFGAPLRGTPLSPQAPGMCQPYPGSQPTPSAPAQLEASVPSCGAPALHSGPPSPPVPCTLLHLQVPKPYRGYFPSLHLHEPLSRRPSSPAGHLLAAHRPMSPSIPPLAGAQALDGPECWPPRADMVLAGVRCPVAPPLPSCSCAQPRIHRAWSLFCLMPSDATESLGY